MNLFFNILSISLRPLFSENERPKNFEILFSLDSLLPSRVNKYFKSESFELDIFSFLRRSMTPLEPILGWRNNFYKPQTHEINFNDKSIKISYEYTKNNFIFYLPKYNCVVKIIKSKNNSLWIEFDGIQEKFKIFKKNNQFFIYSLKYGNISMEIKDRIPSASTKKTKGSYVSPMPSKIIKLLVKVGQKINANEPLIILSSMKMENTIFSYKSGIVDKIRVKEGQNVEKDTLLININEIEK